MWISAVLSMFVAGAQGASAGPHLHHLDGTPVELQVADSVVSLLFVSSVQPADPSAFAQERPELRDDYPVRKFGSSLYIFAVERGLDIVSVMHQLRTDLRVRLVNPVIGDGDGHEGWMTDKLIIRFKDGVPSARIDSLNQALAAYVNPPDPGEPTVYFVRVRSDLHLSTVDMAELYYESGLCRYAQPDFIGRLIPDGDGSRITSQLALSPDTLYAPLDTFYVYQWHWNNHGQTGGTYDADVDADSAWMVTKGNPSVRVAILDGGFDMNHEDIDPLTRIFGYDVAGYLAEVSPPDIFPYPDCQLDPSGCGHGTCVLGELAAAHSNRKGLKGLAPWCTYWIIKMKDDWGYSSDSLIAAGLTARGRSPCLGHGVTE